MDGVAELYQSAVRLHRAGRLAGAEPLYRQILALDPRHADALHMLGVLTFQAGNAAAGVDLIRRAVEIRPVSALYHGNLGMVLSAQGRVDEAIACYRRAVGLEPRYVEGFNNLASLLLQSGRPDEALAACRQALALKPDFAQAHYNIGVAMKLRGDVSGAVAAFRDATTARPDYAEAYNALGDALNADGRHEEAVASLRRAIALRPDYSESFNNLGNSLHEVGRYDEAAASFRSALSLRPEDPEVLNNFATLLDRTGESARAVEMYRRALAVRPAFPQALYNLAGTLHKLGRVDDAVDTFREALRLAPDLAEAHTNLGNALRDAGQLREAYESYRRSASIKSDARMAGAELFALHFDPSLEVRALRERHREWNDRYARPLADRIRPHVNAPDPEKRLRIGYVSPDLSNHPVGRFMAPLLTNHDHGRFEIHCYCDIRRPDELTARLRAAVDHWHDTAGIKDERLAELIQRDGIDVLVDLAMHTSDNRLLLFARKPAPVQCSYLAYPGFTGLETIDYRITDPHLDPPTGEPGLSFDRPVRLPHTFWCYAPPAEADEVRPPPVLTTGRPTFGCLNTFGKVSEPVREAWFRLLRDLPDSRLLIHAREGRHRERFREEMKAAGLDPGRVEFVGFLKTAEYFRQYHRIDVALDTFPYAGGTTTCDALWMGVPVVTRPGDAPISRGGASILSNVGLPDLIVGDFDQYVVAARDLAADVETLKSLRAGMRARMLASPLMDAPRFARDIETAYRMMWREWCASRSPA